MTYDVVIIGAGPAGLSAAGYSARAGMKTLVIEKYPVAGGQMNLTDTIDNFPALDSCDGMEIASRLRTQAENSGAEFVTGTVTLLIDGTIKKVITDDGEIGTKTIIFAAGAEHRKLGVKGEAEFSGRGVSYCAVCDGGFYRKKTVAVIGGGDSALREALYLSRICEKVYLIHRRESFRGSDVLKKSCEEAENIEMVLSAFCTEIFGEKKVEGIRIETEGQNVTINCSGVFVAVGMEPCSSLLNGICELDENGYVIAGEDCVTSAQGIFAAGDVRTKPFRQIITACSDGAGAAYSAGKYINEH